jgi:hypothetical protein
MKQRTAVLRLLTTTIAVIAAMAVSLGLALPASAAPETAVNATVSSVAGSASATLTDKEMAAGYRELIQALKAAGAQSVNGEVKYFVDGYGWFTISEPTSSGPSELGGGVDFQGIYVTFNQLDQTAIAVGSTAALVAGICAIPGVGQVACGAAGVIVSIAAVYLNEYGRCSEGRSLKVYVFGARSSECF